jgi:hypothetical protein
VQLLLKPGSGATVVVAYTAQDLQEEAGFVFGQMLALAQVGVMLRTMIWALCKGTSCCKKA